MDAVEISGVYDYSSSVKSLVNALKREGIIEENYYYKLPKDEFTDCFYDEDDRVYQFLPFVVAAKLETHRKAEKATRYYEVWASYNEEKWYPIGYVYKRDKKISAMKKENKPFYVTFTEGTYKSVSEGENENCDIVYHVEKHVSTVYTIYLSTSKEGYLPKSTHNTTFDWQKGVGNRFTGKYFREH